MNQLQTQRGYTLLFAVLTAVLVLGIAIFILSVSKKQYALSVAARESTYSFYAADSGIECAVAAIIVSTSTTATPNAGHIDCNGDQTVIDTFTDVVTAFELTQAHQSPATDIPLENNQCAKIQFTTGLDSSSEPKTIIESRGYNICNGAVPILSNPRLVERALRLTKYGVW